MDLQSIVNTKETETLEAKLAAGGLPDSLWETYSAFANTNGGVILLGVEESRDKTLHLHGVTDPDGMVAEFWQMVRTPSKCSADVLRPGGVYVQNEDGKDIIVIEVPRADRRDKPVYINGDILQGTYRRSGEGDYHCTEQEIKAMLQDKEEITRDTLPLAELGSEAFDEATVRDFRGRVRRMRPNDPANELNDEEFLVNYGAAVKDRTGLHPTGGGLLVLGKREYIVREFTHFYLEYREYEKDDAEPHIKLTSMTDSDCRNLYNFYFCTAEKLISGQPRSVEKAVSAALANALIHANYYNKFGIVVEKRDQNVMISNPGGIRVSLKDSMSKNSDPRNREVARLFAGVGIGSGKGEGMGFIRNQENCKVVEKFDPDMVVFTWQGKRIAAPR